jgi:nucleotide-binding universal stress UspA family protein
LSPTVRAITCGPEPHMVIGLTMYHHILVPIDGSDLSERAIAHSVALAKAHNAKITALHVTVPLHLSALDSITVAQDTQQQDLQLDKELASRHLEAAANAARAVGVPCDTVHAVHDHPYQAIIDAAKSYGCDLIAMASHGRRGISAIVLGSETTKVLTHTTIPVLVLR